MIGKNEIFDFLFEKITAEFPNAYISGKYEPVPASFPAVFIREIGRYSQPRNMTFSNAQGIQESTYEVQVMSNKVDYPKEEAEEIMNVVIGAFFAIPYRLDGRNVVEDGENGIYKMRASFRKTWGDADTMPEVIQ